MHPFYVSAVDECGGFYDAASYATADDVRQAISEFDAELDFATGHRAYLLRCAIAELTDQLATAESL